MTSIGYIVGSISSGSINRRYAKALERLAPEGVRLVEIPIKELPMYSRDYDADFPRVARDFKQAIADADGVIIVTPEYSRSVPGVLKNALDWAARPGGEGVFPGKPVALTGTSQGAIGTALAQAHLKTIMLHLGARLLGQPEVYFQSREEIFGADGEITSEGTADMLSSFLNAVVDHVTANAD